MPFPRLLSFRYPLLIALVPDRSSARSGTLVAFDGLSSAFDPATSVLDSARWTVGKFSDRKLSVLKRLVRRQRYRTPMAPCTSTLSSCA